MKKSLLALTLLTAVFFSCKKTTTTDFTATDVTGSTLVKGTCTKNVVTPDGIGGWTTSNKVPAVGVSVQMKVNKNQLYPASIAQGADTYAATTNTNGDWSMSVKSNATGVNAYMTIAGFNSTQDTLINGNLKTGLYANYFGMTTNTITLYMGTTFDCGVFNFSASNLSTNPNNIMIGNATVSGSISLSLATKIETGTLVTVGCCTPAPVPAGITVYASMNQDPSWLATKMYTTQTTAGGYYSFVMSTVPIGTPGFNQNVNVWVADYAATRDTHYVKNGVIQPIITGIPGVYNGGSAPVQTGVYIGEIRNANHFSFAGFTPN